MRRDTTPSFTIAVAQVLATGVGWWSHFDDVDGRRVFRSEFRFRARVLSSALEQDRGNERASLDQ